MVTERTSPMDDGAHRQKPKIVAEIGCNHKGDVEIAKEMIRIAKVFCNVDYAKFQKRNPRELLTPEQYNAPHPNPHHAYGSTYGEHREALELDLGVHRALKACCEEIGIGYSTSVWDVSSAREIISMKPDFIKVPSAHNTNVPLLTVLCDEYDGDLHVSLGMTTRKEEEQLVYFLERKDRLQDTVLYQCTSGYPVPPRDICLLEIRRLVEAYGARAKAIGFSGHYTGIGLDGPAFVLGADWIERHFTLDRAWKGTDHAASLEPDGLRRVRKDTAAVAEALRHRDREILAIEEEQRAKLKYRSA